MRGYFIHLLSLQTSFAKDKTLQYLTKQSKVGLFTIYMDKHDLGEW